MLGDAVLARLLALPAGGPAEQQLHEWFRGCAILARGDERRVAVAKSLPEDGVDDVEDRRAAAEVLREREAPAEAFELVAARSEQVHVGVPEAVDRLQLVPDGEQVLLLELGEDRKLARVCVLELVDHQQLETLGETPAHALAPLEQITRVELQIVEVHRALLSLEVLIPGREPLEQLAEEQAHPPRAALGLLLALRRLRAHARAAADGAGRGCAARRGCRGP